MMADNVEHVITYWVLWQKFHSPALVGFEVISHWLPYLLLSVWLGSLIGVALPKVGVTTNMITDTRPAIHPGNAG